MTPLQITILLHYGTTPNITPTWGDIDKELTALVNKELIFENEGPPGPFCLTDRGKTHVESLLSVPLPVCTWVTPTDKKPPFVVKMSENGGWHVEAKSDSNFPDGEMTIRTNAGAVDIGDAPDGRPNNRFYREKFDDK